MHRNILITSKNGLPLNEVANLFLERADKIIDDLASFELIVGKATSFGSGEPPVLEFRLSAKIDQSAVKVEEKLDNALSILHSISTELDFEIEFKENTGKFKNFP